MRVDQEWATSAAARRILAHWLDARPAWLWSGDGTRLIWRNPAARLFNAKLKKTGLRLAAEPVPIKGQVARLIRLGSPGRSSLSRIQFLAGGRPVSTTCSVTPLALADGTAALLIVGVDAIDAEVLAHRGKPDDPLAETLLPTGSDYLLIGRQGEPIGGSETGHERYAPLFRSGRLPLPDETAECELEDEHLTLTRLTAGPGGEQLLLIAGGQPDKRIEAVRAEEGLTVFEPETGGGDGEGAGESPRPSEAEEPGPAGEGADEAAAATAAVPEPSPAGASLSSLFDRLADTPSLFSELSADDERPISPPPDAAAGEPPPGGDERDEAGGPDPLATTDGETREPAETAGEFDPARPTQPEAGAMRGEENAEAGPLPTEGKPEGEGDAERSPRGSEPDVIAAVIEFEDDLSQDRSLATSYRVTGRGFTPLDLPAGGNDGTEADEPTGREPASPETVDRASRYNFDELSRILADRVGNGGVDLPAEAVEVETPPPPPPAPAPAPEGALVSIAGETFILNRLPIGILVFRDQQVLFANRALTDLTGYESVDGLRGAGIASIFPADDAASAGPVTHLLRRDGTAMPVTARLQTITWQGRPALMLSASAAEMRIGHEGAVRSFAERLATTREEGYFEADRAGTVRAINAAARAALGRAGDEMAGEPLAGLVHPDDAAALQQFLERPARFAETARPAVALAAAAPGCELILFAEGQAGLVTGYFGFVRHRQAGQGSRTTPAAPQDHDDVDPSMLARISRGVRRPLNTIIGFADLIRSSAFGTVENHRYLEYARDIKTAGQEIAVLIEELDEFARLKAGKYAPRPADLDLAALLESCVVRVRGQASAARVLVRSAISERLPHIRADRASLGQAVLNLLASAIDQSPSGGSVILSAQLEEDGSVAVNIRDSGAPGADPGERFVVFRDGVGKDGEALAPVRSSVGLALTRSLVAVNACRLSVNPAGTTGTLFSMIVPADLVAQQQAM